MNHNWKYKTNLCPGRGDRPAVGGDGEAPGVEGLPRRRLPGEHRAGRDMIMIIIGYENDNNNQAGQDMIMMIII